MAHVHPSKFRAMPEVRQQVLREELQGVAVTHLHILKNHRAIVQAFRLACSWGPALAEGNVGLNGWMSFCARVNLYYPAPEDAGRSAETVTDLHMTVNADSTPEEQREVEEMLASIRHRQADLVKRKATKIIPTWRETEEPKVGRYNRRLSIGAGSQKRRMESVSAMHNMVLALNGVGDDLVQEKPTLDSEYLEAAFAFAARGVERIGMQDFTVLLVVTAAQAYPHIASDDPEAAVRKLLHEFVAPAVSDLCPESAEDIFARSPVRLFPDVSTVVELFREVFRGAFIALRDLVTHKIPFDILASFFAQIGVHKAGHFTEASLRQAYCDAGQTTWSAAPDAIELERFIDVSIFVAFQLYGMEPHKSSLPTIAGRLYVFMMTWQQWYRRKLGRNVEADKVHPQPDDPRITRMSTVVVDATMAHQIEIMGKNFSDRQMYFRFGDLVTMTRQLHDGTAVVEVPPATTNAIEIRLTERDEDYFVAVVHVKRVQVTASITGDHFSPPHSRDFVYQNVLPATSLSQFQGQLYRVWQNYSQIKDTNNFVLLKYSQWKRLLQDFKLLPTDDEVRKALEEHHRIAEEQKREQELHTISIRRTSNSQVQPAVPHSRGGASRASKGSIDMGRVKMASRGSDVSSRQTVTFGTLGTTSPASPASPASPTLSDPSGAFSEHSDVRGLLPPALAETLLNTAVTHTGAAVTDDLKAMKQREQQMKLVFSLHAQSCRMAPNGLLVNPNSAEAVHEGLAKPRSDKRKSGRSRSQFSFSSVALARKQSIAGAASSTTSPTRSHSTFGQELFGGSTGKPPLANGSPSPPTKPDPALDLFDHEEEPDSDEETNDRSKWISVEGLSFEHFLKAICHALVLHRGSVVDGLNDMLSADLWVGRELLEDVASNNRGALSLRIRRAAHQLKIDSALQNVEHLPSPRRPSDPSAEEETREFLEAELGPYVPAGRWLNAEAHDRQLVSFVMTERQREEDYRTRAAEAMKRFETAPRALDIDTESAEPFHNQGKAGEKKPATAEERAAIVKKELGRMLMHTQRDTYGLALRTNENKSRQQALQMDRLKSELEAQKARADAAEAKLQKGAQMGNHADGTFDGDSVGGRGVLRAEKQELQRLFIQQVERKKHQLEAAHRDQENLRDIERDRVVGELQQQMQVADLCFRRMQDTVKAQTDMLRKEADVTLTLRKRIDTLMEDSTFFRQATERLFGVVEKGKHRDLVDELETARQAHEDAMLELTQEMFGGAHDTAKATSPTQSPRTGGPKSARKSVVRPVRRSEVSIRSDRDYKPGAPGGRRSIAELVEQGNSMIAAPNGFVLPDVPVITTHYTTDEVNEIKRRLEDELERKGEAQTTAMEKKAKAAEMALSAKIEHLQAEVRLAQASAQARQEALQQRQRQSTELQAELTTTVKGLEDRVSTASKNAANAEAELAKRKEAADKLSDEVSALRTITQELEEQVERQAEALEAEEAKRVAAEDALHTQTLRQSRERAEALRSRSDHGADDEEISTEPSDETSYETEESEEDFDSEEAEESDEEENEEGEPGVDANNETRRGSGPLASTGGHVEPDDGVDAAPPKPISKRTKSTTRTKPKNKSTKPHSSKALLTPQSSRDVNSSRRRQRKPIGRQGSPSQARKHRGSEEASRTPSPARRTKSGGGGSDRPMGSNADTSSMDMVAVRVDTAEGVFPHPAPAEVRSDIETPAAHPPGSSGAAAGSPDGQGTGHVPRKANRRRRDKRSKSPRPATGEVKGSGSREAFTGHVFSDDEEYEEYGELLGEADAFEVHEMVKLHTGADVSIVKHTLKFGDTLQDIARLYGVPIEAVLRRNFIAAPELPKGYGSLAEVPAEELRFLLDDANLVVHGIPSKMLTIPVRTGTPGAMAAMSPDRRLDGGFLKRKATPQPTPGFSPAAHSAVISHSIISGVAALPPAPATESSAVVAQETLPPMDESKRSLPTDHDEKTGEDKNGEDKDDDDDAEGETPIGDSQRRPTVIPQPSLPRDAVDAVADTAKVLVLQQQQAVQQQAAQQQQVQVRALATEASTLKQELQMLKAAVATMTSAAMSQTDGQLPKLEALIAKVAEQSQPPPPPPPSGLPPDLPPRAVGTPSQGTRPRSRQAMTPDNIGGSRSKVVSRGSDTGALGAVRPPRPAEAIDDDGRSVVVGASETDTGSPRQATTPRSSRVLSPVETAAAAEVSQPMPVGDPDQVPRARGSTPSRGLRRQTPKQKAEHLEAEAGEFTAAPQIAVAATMDAPADDDRAVTFVAKRLSDASSLQSGSAQGLAPSFPQLQDLDGTGSRGAASKAQNQNTLGVIPIETFFSTSDLHESRRPSVAPVGALANSSISGFGTTGEMGVWAAGARPAEPPRGDVIETPQKTKARPGGVPPKPQGSRLIPMTLASLVVADEAAAPQPLGARSMPGKGLLFVSATKVGSKVDSGAQTLVMDRVASRMAQHEEAARLQVMLLEHRTLEALVAAFNHTGDHLMGTHGTLSSGGGLRTASRSPDRDLMDDTVGGASPSHLQQQMTSTGERQRRGSLFQGPAFAGTGGSTVDDLKPPEGMVGATATLHDQGASRAAARAERVAQRQTELQAQRAAEVRRRFDATAERLAAAERNAAHGARLRKFTTDQVRRGRKDDAAALAAKVKQQRSQRGTLQSKLPPLAATPEPRDRSRSTNVDQPAGFLTPDPADPSRKSGVLSPLRSTPPTAGAADSSPSLTGHARGGGRPGHHHQRGSNSLVSPVKFKDPPSAVPPHEAFSDEQEAQLLALANAEEFLKNKKLGVSVGRTLSTPIGADLGEFGTV